MAKWNDVVITDMGMQLSAQTLAGKKIVYTHAQTTDLDLSGKTPDQIKAMTELTSVKQDIPISSISVNDKETVKIFVKITNEGVKQDYMLYGLAVFAKIDDNPEVLYEVVTAQKPDLVPALTGTTLSGINFSLLTHVAKSENASIIVGAGGLNEDEVLELINDHTIDLSDYVTQQQLGTKVADLNNGLSTKVTDNKDGTIEVNGRSITPADDSGVVHYSAVPNSLLRSYLTSGTDLNTITNPGIFPFNQCTFVNDINSTRKWGAIINTVLPNQIVMQEMVIGNNQVYGYRIYNEGNNSWSSWLIPADDSKVVHTADTSNWQKQKITNDDGGNKYSFTTANTTDLAAAIQALPLGYHTFYCQSGVKGNPSSQSVRGIAEITTAGANPLGVGYLTDSTGDFWSFYVDSHGLNLNNKQDKLEYTPANAANVVDRNPNTGVVSTPVDFTKLTVNGGKSVATSDDLKSVEDASWRQLDNKYIVPASGHTLSPATTILYKIDDSNHKLYLSGSIALDGSANGVSVIVQLGSIIKSMLTCSVPYLGLEDGFAYTWSLVFAHQSGATDLTFVPVKGVLSIASTSGTQRELAFVTYDELI